MTSLTKCLSVFILVLSLVTLSLVGYQRFSASAAAAAPQAATCNIVLSSSVPHDAIIPASHIGNPTAIQVDFDTLSWNSFIALNWPADPNYAGRPDPDPNKKVGLQDYSPVVWETYKESYDVFIADAQGNPVRPPGWNSVPQPPPGCDQNTAYAAKLGKPVRVVKNISKDGLNEFLEAFVMAPLIDQKGAFARYEVLMNEEEFTQIMNPVNPITGLVAPPLYDARNQINVNFPVGKPGGPEGPIEVKAAWKILGPLDNPGRYHTEWIQIAWPATTKPATKYKCSQPILVGLIALHIAHKTFNAPQWAWSTFEQVDNYTVPPGSPPGRKASFFNPDCPASVCPPNKQPTAPTGGWNGDPSVLNQGPPTQVVPGAAARVQPNCNDVAKQLLLSVNPNTVWQYYRLVSTQWPQTPYCSGNQPCPVYEPVTLAHQGADQLPRHLANAMIETYFMGPPESKDNPTCMFCHSTANGLITGKALDFSFALQEAYPINSQGLQAQRRAMAMKSGIRIPPAGPKRSAKPKTRT
ncbi:MAG TPA: hypothetical protein VF961_02585 [Pyrinomonadaceae bacterium]